MVFLESVAVVASQCCLLQRYYPRSLHFRQRHGRDARVPWAHCTHAFNGCRHGRDIISSNDRRVGARRPPYRSANTNISVSA
jgi:hypothetical protein